jgi:DNA-binding transcriptional LysR family regulator
VDIDLKGVRSFVALTEDLSFTQTAARLLIPQPRLSLRIRALEDQLGFRLFNRTSRRVQLTAQGARMLPHAIAILEQLEQLEGEARKIRYVAGSSVTIGAVDYARPLKSRIVGKFMLEHPAIAVEIDTISSNSDGLGKLVDGAWDMALILENEQRPVPPEFETLCLARLPIGLLMPEAASPGGDGHFDPRHLKDQRVAIFRRDASPLLYDQLEDILYSSGAKLIRLPEASQTGLVEFVQETGLPSICARWWIDPSDAPNGLVHLPIKGCDVSLSCMLVRRRGLASRSNEHFWKVARKLVGQSSYAN